jgi:hypothetical protein
MRKSRFTGADHWDVEGTRSGGQGRGAVPAASGSTFGSRLIGAHPCQRRKKVLPPSTFSHHRQTKALNAFWRVLPGDGKWSSLPISICNYLIVHVISLSEIASFFQA